MGKLSAAAATMHTLSMTAMEEASRLGARDTDIDHLFVALVASEQAAGQVLRALGVTLHGARQAIADQHAEDLGAIGIDMAPPQPGPIVFNETGGYEWTSRAGKVLNSVSEKNSDGSATAVLRALIDEPSGFISGVLMRLGVDPLEVRERLDAAARIPDFGGGADGAETVDWAGSGQAGSPGRTAAPGEAPLGRSPGARPHGQATPKALARAVTGFVPAPPNAVWELLADPGRMPEWEEMLESVDPASVSPQPSPGAMPEIGATWEGRGRTHAPDGKPLRTRASLNRIAFELVEASEPARVAWRLSFPDEPNANTRLLEIQLEHAAGGTAIRARIAWERSVARRSLQGWALRPVTRMLLWLQATKIVGGVSRVFRSA
ncbi:Clp protease N-terminal domain-containing protein [Leucobacter sp. NPDC015123]|uniref:SRPBCC family protein n=1 Tax=Leucobacter sp. NPDC015123 TaxID=3364129 RepID=UPI0036F48F9D